MKDALKLKKQSNNLKNKNMSKNTPQARIKCLNEWLADFKKKYKPKKKKIIYED